MTKHISGLNGIRAIAVLMVIIAHRFPLDHFLLIIPIGHFGVDIFFVLSGFLISRILFNDLKKVKAKTATSFELIKRFVIRRMLRIFPIYYLLLFFMYLTSGIIGNDFKENFLWYFFYVSNFLVYTTGKWYGCVAHLWSLSVEEQFYLFWPVLILVFFKNRIFILLVATILIGTIAPLFIDGITYVLTISCISAFGLGALLAYIEIIKPEKKSIFIKVIPVAAIISFILIVINYYIYKFPVFFDRLFISLITVSIITHCCYSQKSFLVTKILENKILRFIGLISYGIYLYHHVVPKYWEAILKRYGIETASTLNEFSYLEFFIQTSFIIFLSYLSWIFIEKPILKIKDRI